MMLLLNGRTGASARLGRAACRIGRRAALWRSRDMTIDHPTAEAGTIRLAAGLCLKRVDLTKRIRLLGVRVGSLRKASAPDG